MSRTRQPKERHIRIRGVRRQPVDIRKLARAVIALAQAEAEAAARGEHEGRTTETDVPKREGDAA